MVWEHMVLTFGTNDHAAMYNALNQLGSVGWEVAGITGVDKTVGLNAVLIAMKRERAEMTSPDDTTAGWKHDPWRRAAFRWWGGDRWSEQIVDGADSKPRTDWPMGAPAD